ncbi:MAG: TraB/GumN family protein [Bdellovibrionaceae bacterium]|nr:TraB/GumN family protein [Pseudobdellovibrionaceae bacterium]
MRLKTPIFFVLFLGLLLSVSETRSETLRPFFYRIEKDGKVAHLLGTIHSGVNYSELPSSLREIAKASASLVIETDLIKAQPLTDAAYRSGDEARLLAIFQQPGAEFIAVGAGHLLGQSGLLAGLRAQGYSVTDEGR